MQAEQTSEYRASVRLSLNAFSVLTLAASESRFMCSQCEDKFTSKNGMLMHERFYCSKRDIPSSHETPLTIQATDPEAMLPLDSVSPAPSSASSAGHFTVPTWGDMSAYITTVRDLDVVVPDMRQDEIVPLLKSQRFKQIMQRR